MNDNGYICLNCNRSFEEANEIQEPDGLDTPPYRYTSICPYCGDDNIVKKIGNCDYCDTDICEGEMYYVLNGNGKIYCVNCISERNN